MQYKYFLLLFFCASAYPMWNRLRGLNPAQQGTSSGQRTSSLFFTPRSRISSRSLAIPTSLLRAPVLSRIARITTKGWPAVFAVAGAVKAFTQRQAAPLLTIKSEEITQYEALRSNISDILKKEQSRHLVQRGYPRLAPTTESQHFERYYPVERINQLIKTKKLEDQLKKDYFPLLAQEENLVEQFQEERQNILAEQQKQSPNWWQRITGQKSSKEKESEARLVFIQEQINSRKRSIQEKTPQLQAIKARIESLD